MKIDHLFSTGTSARNTDIAALILRLVAAFAVAYSHGWPKLNTLLGDDPVRFVDPFGLGMAATMSIVMFAEFICAIFVALGLFTRATLIPLLINMTYLVFVHHWPDRFGIKELPLLFLTIWWAIMLLGPGKYSLDNLINRKRAAAKE